jgi:hypothetical protein
MTNKETLQNGVWNEIIRSEVRAGKNWQKIDKWNTTDIWTCQ